MADTKRKLGDKAWVEFKATGYPFKLKRMLREAPSDNEVIELIAPFIVACEVPAIDGTTVTSIKSLADLENIEERVVAELIYEFYNFRGERLGEPLPK